MAEGNQGKPANSKHDEHPGAKPPGPDEKSSGKPEANPEEKPQAATPKWPWFVGIAVILVFTAFVLYSIWVPHALQETNDAYVTAHFATIAPRVAGQVSAIGVADNQFVRAGELLVALDDRYFLTAVSQS